MGSTTFATAATRAGWGRCFRRGSRCACSARAASPGRRFKLTLRSRVKLPALLDRIDAWLDAGVLGAERLNAADFMIAPSIALIAYRLDLRSQIEARPAGAYVERVLPEPPVPRPARR